MGFPQSFSVLVDSVDNDKTDEREVEGRDGEIKGWSRFRQQTNKFGGVYGISAA